MVREDTAVDLVVVDLVDLAGAEDLVCNLCFHRPLLHKVSCVTMDLQDQNIMQNYAGNVFTPLQQKIVEEDAVDPVVRTFNKKIKKCIFFIFFMCIATRLFKRNVPSALCEALLPRYSCRLLS